MAKGINKVDNSLILESSGALNSSSSDEDDNEDDEDQINDSSL